MFERTITLLSPSGDALSVQAGIEGDQLWLDREDLLRATGFELKPEGFCKDEFCYPLPPSRRAEFADEGRVNVAAFWRHRSGAVASSRDGDTWCLGDAKDEYASRVETLEAPDFTLPDMNGELHSLSDYRGQKVLLTTWASWCGCRNDLPVWNRLVDEVGADNLKVIAVALDSTPGAPEPWIEKAAPAYLALIDREHHIAELYNLVNVPQAVWIDEEGRIVRPPEAAGAFDFLNKREAGGQGMTPELIEKSRDTRLMYLEALKDWVAKGDASDYAYSEHEVRARISAPDSTILEAHANFRLGQHLVAQGRGDEGREFIDKAKELHPDSWAMFREAAEKLESGPMAGIAAAADFQARLATRAQENKPYYAPIEMDGIPN